MNRLGLSCPFMMSPVSRGDLLTWISSVQSADHRYAYGRESRMLCANGMPRESVIRAGAVILLIGLLGGMAVLGGLGWPIPAEDGPTPEEIADDIDAYSGESVAFTGTVVATDMDILEVEHSGGTFLLKLVGIDHDLTIGDRVTVSGTLGPEGTLDATTGAYDVRHPWEFTYMYVVSIVGVVVAGLVVANYWRLDARRFEFSPRETPIHASRWGGRRG